MLLVFVNAEQRTFTPDFRQSVDAGERTHRTHLMSKDGLVGRRTWA